MIAAPKPNRTLEWLRPPPGPVLLAIMLAHHFGLWWRVTVNRGIAWNELLNHWDAGAYTEIVTNGYHDAFWAFFPLYPTLVRSLVALTGALLAPAIAGTLLSTALLAVFVFACRPNGLLRFVTTRPVTPWGMALILYGPASFILHSHHTEALFLLLSFFALQSAQRGEAVIATGCAALVLWARLQGVLVGATVLALLFVCVRQKKLTLGAVCFSAAAITVSGLALLYSRWALSGDPLIFFHVQSNWAHVRSPLDVLRAVWFGNDWQNTSSGSLMRHVWFFATLPLCVWFCRRHAVLGAYALISLFPMFMQGEFVNAFRFTLVLFPLWFWLGARLERAPLPLRYALAAALIALNHVTAHRYALAQWSY